MAKNGKLERFDAVENLMFSMVVRYRKSVKASDNKVLYYTEPLFDDIDYENDVRDSLQLDTLTLKSPTAISLRAAEFENYILDINFLQKACNMTKEDAALTIEDYKDEKKSRFEEAQRKIDNGEIKNAKESSELEYLVVLTAFDETITPALTEEYSEKMIDNFARTQSALKAQGLLSEGYMKKTKKMIDILENLNPQNADKIMSTEKFKKYRGLTFKEIDVLFDKDGNKKKGTKSEEDDKNKVNKTTKNLRSDMNRSI